MSLLDIAKKAANSARSLVLDNLENAAELTGGENPFGDATLLLDKQAEDRIIEVLRDSKFDFTILTEEVGEIDISENPEYVAIIDPIDGSTNLSRGIPLCAVGIGIAPFDNDLTTSDVEISVISSIFHEEEYVAVADEGAKLNGKPIRPSSKNLPDRVIISYDTKKALISDFGPASLGALQQVYDMRRTGANLLDLCWTAAGKLEAMVDMRNILPVVHVSGTHMVLEAGGVVIDEFGDSFEIPLDLDHRMSFIAANTMDLADTILRGFRLE
jgi:fructose-1,6-bisphosphatase/inositol monophosphatase family enzyme